MLKFISFLSKRCMRPLLHLPKFNFVSHSTISSNKNFELPIVTMTSLQDNPGARKQKRRLGRGPGSGKGKTSGRGHKGYKARVGNPSRYFEGGQTRLARRLPKFGFRRTKYRDQFSYINLEKIIYLIFKKRLDPTKPITSKEIFWAGGVSKVKCGIKVLGRGSDKLSTVPPLNLVVSSASQLVIDEIKKHGGSVTCIHSTKSRMRYLVKPYKYYKDLLEPLPKFKAVKRLERLRAKGASVKFIAPKWMQYKDLPERERLHQEKVASIAHPEVLPHYPPKNIPHQSDNKKIPPKPKIWRKISYEAK